MSDIQPRNPDRGRDRIEKTFDYQLDKELHHGAQVAVYRNGELIVNLADGITGPDGNGTDPETRFITFSAGKPVAAACVHLLAERGHLNYNDQVIEYWPEFADEGTEKSQVTIRHVLSHQAGMPWLSFDGPASFEGETKTEWSDPDASARAIEEADLDFSPGSQGDFHVLSFGWLIREIVRRVAGKRIHEFARTEIFEPLGLERTCIGLPDGEPDDVADVVAFDTLGRITGDDGVSEAIELHAEVFNREVVRRSVVPAANVISTASELARFYACLLNEGEFGGKRLFDQATIDEWTTFEAHVTESVGTPGPIPYGLGMQLGGLHQDFCGVTAPLTLFGHPGSGGVFGWADPENDLAAAYLSNGLRHGFTTNMAACIMSDTIRHELGKH